MCTAGQKRPPIELADILRRHGARYQRAHAGHLGRVEQRVMRAIVACRTAALGGHVEKCDDCGAIRISYCSCRNRHCPKCQGPARYAWLEARQSELLPVSYFHIVFTLPPEIAEIAFQNKALVYGILFKAATEAMTTLTADPRRLGARGGGIAVLHTWGQTLTHHPHIHCVVPGGGLSPDGTKWIHCRNPNFFLPVKLLGALFRNLFIQRLTKAFRAGTLSFFNGIAYLAEPPAFGRLMKTMRGIKWVVYAKAPFAGPEQVLRYLSRYTHRVAIANSRLVAFDDHHVTFKWKDYRQNNAIKNMKLTPDEFIRRFLLHTLPDGFHRIRSFGFLANCHRAAKLDLCRKLLGVRDYPKPSSPDIDTDGPASDFEPEAEKKRATCPECGGPMRLLERLPHPGVFCWKAQPHGFDTS